MVFKYAWNLNDPKLRVWVVWCFLGAFLLLEIGSCLDIRAHRAASRAQFEANQKLIKENREKIEQLEKVIKEQHAKSNP